ncbi:hypothetical protein NL676_022654 [Syzygium grande]|nr:hypothetical protein NL676_022654 [Syzygium grande]
MLIETHHAFFQRSICRFRHMYGVSGVHSVSRKDFSWQFTLIRSAASVKFRDLAPIIRVPCVRMQSAIRTRVLVTPVFHRPPYSLGGVVRSGHRFRCRSQFQASSSQHGVIRKNKQGIALLLLLLLGSLLSSPVFCAVSSDRDMTALLRKFLPVVSTVPKEENDDGDYSLEYSIALEYKGPLFSGDIPQALPVNIDEIPKAAVFPAESLLLDRSLPIIQPIGKRDFNQNLFKELGISKEVFYSAHSIEPSVGNAGSGTCALSNGNDTSLKSAGELDSSRGSDHEDERVSKSSDSVEDETNIISEPKLPDDFAEANMQMQSADSAPPRPSLNNLSQMEEDSDNEMPHHAKKPSAVTFRDPDSADIFDEQSVFNEVDSFPVKQRAENNGKKGSCYRCFKGNRFTEKEVCIVCDAKMLKWLLPEPEMKQIMSSEVLSPANQIPPNLVYVNGEALDNKELLRLRGCPNPPKKLRPGYYWYDKAAGFWGKEGQKPCQIISAQLNVGGYIKRDASNGNTDVLINNREITKEEVWMLKSAGIPCEGKPHFWVSADGSYQEEGQKNAKGRIWDKTKTKLVCAILSLPIPPDNAKSGEETTKDSRGQNDLHHKLLLVGFDKSGHTHYIQAGRPNSFVSLDVKRSSVKFRGIMLST